MSAPATALLVLLFAAHFLGDFTPLSTARMQQAKSVGRPVGPIAAHAGVHAVLIALAVSLTVWPGWRLVAVAAAIAFATHLAIDWAKGRLGAGRPDLFNLERQVYWTAFGLDQLAHGLVLIWIAALVA